MLTPAHFLPAASLCNPRVPKKPVSFFYSRDIEEVLGQGPLGPPSSHTSHRVPRHYTHSYGYLEKRHRSAGSAQGSSQFKTGTFHTVGHRLAAGSGPSSFILLEPSPGCLALASAGVGQASQLPDLERAHLSEV